MLAFSIAFVLIVIATALVLGQVLSASQSTRRLLAWVVVLMAMMVGFGFWLGTLMDDLLS